MKPRRSRLEVGSTGLLYMAITALTFGAAFYSQANLMFLALGLLVGGLVVSLGWVWIGMRGLYIERLPVTHGVAGEELVLRYRLTKGSRMPAFSLVIQETWGRGPKGYKRRGPVTDKPRRLLERPTGWVTHLGSKQTVQAQASCWPARRGRLPLERIEVYCDFPFGIIRRVLVFDAAEEVTVLPRMRRMTRQAMGAITRLDAGGYHQLDKEGGTEEFYSLRRYRKGDSLKVIDWKHTARTGKLLSRELTQPVPPTLMILLDLSDYAPADPDDTPPPRDAEAELRIDRAIALTASLVCDAFIAGYRVGLVVSGAQCEPMGAHHSLPHRSKALEQLALLEAGTAPPLSRQIGAAPSVVVRPGAGTGRAVRLGRHGVTLFGDDLNRLTVYAQPRHLLSQRVQPKRAATTPAASAPAVKEAG